MILFLFLFLIFSISCNSLEYGEPFDCTNGIPNINQQETVVRCAVVDFTESMGKYKGMDLFIETRHRGTGKYLWFADVKFHSSDKGPKTTNCTTSNVTIEYSSAPGFFQYPQVPLVVKQPPIRFFHVDRETIDPNTTYRKDSYKYYIDRSIIEFTLQNPLSLELLNNTIKQMKERQSGWLYNWDELPKYTILGYAHKERAWNCAVFSVALLQKLGINLCGSSDVLRNFIRYEYGGLKWPIGAGLVVGAVVVAGVVVYPPAAAAFYTASSFSSGAAAAASAASTAAGGISATAAAAGSIAGGSAFGFGKSVHDIVYDRAYPWVILNEIITNHHRFNIKPSFFIPVGHTINDHIGIERRRLIEGNPNKYNEWYDCFMGGNDYLSGFVVEYDY